MLRSANIARAALSLAIATLPATEISYPLNVLDR